MELSFRTVKDNRILLQKDNAVFDAAKVRLFFRLTKRKEIYYMFDSDCLFQSISIHPN